VRAVADLLRASWIDAHLAPDVVLEAADNALSIVETLPADELPDVFGITSVRDVQVVASASRARAAWYQGDVDTARAGLQHLLEEGNLYPTWHVNVLGTLALLEACSGLLERARQYATYGFRIAAETGRSDAHPSLVYAYLAMAHVLLARDDPARAEMVLADAFEAATRSAGSHMSLALHALEQACFERARSRPRAALEYLRAAERRQPGVPPLIAARLRAAKARALLSLDDVASAERALDLGGIEPTVEVAAAAIQVALARNDPVFAQQVLASWPRDGSLWSDLNCSLAQALVTDAEGDRREALSVVEGVVAAAEPEGHLLLFIDAGPRAQRLLRALFQAQPTPYLRQLVQPEQPVPAGRGTSTGELHAPLSARELLVLHYLPSRMTHAEIAAQLFVSLNTVKTQVRSIYTKLGAHGRKDAIDRAEELDLL
jgi:LuxR family maltose regulon positive regulatory protein